MALLWFATEQNKTGESMIQLDETSKKLQAFEAQLNKVLEDIESTEA
jgi:hypothetical protein